LNDNGGEGVANIYDGDETASVGDGAKNPCDLTSNVIHMVIPKLLHESS
jgi:hypothetical protein